MEASEKFLSFCIGDDMSWTIVFLFLLLSCSHGGGKMRIEKSTLLKYVDDKKNIKNCSEQKIKYFVKKNQSGYWNEAGVCHFLEGNYNKAIFYLDMSLKKSGKNSSSSALNNLGVINAHFKRYRRAYSFFKRALESDPKSLVVKLNLAHLYMKFKRYGDADGLLKKLDRKYAQNRNLQKARNRLKKMRTGKR